MQTIVLKPGRAGIKKAASVIREGGLVAFPTETVYGLGANAFDAKAVKKIFIAKGRPADNPLIVHICKKSDLEMLAAEIPQLAKKLAARFWPGPLTIVLKKKSIVPAITTAGLDTIAVRMPANKTALELIRQSRCPIAAPSANLAGKPSGTTAKHVLEDFEGKIDAIIFGGNARFGIESTVVKIDGKEAVLLRPGALPLEKLQAVARTIRLHPSLLDPRASVKKPASPGMKYRHYAPRAEVALVKGSRALVEKTAESLAKKGKTVAILSARRLPASRCRLVRFKDAGAFAKGLFSSFRELDKKGFGGIIVDAVEEKGIGFALMNRIKKASLKK